jgi:plastocyanin domain-containing protein
MNQVTGNVVKDDEVQTINMDVTRAGYSPNSFVSKKGVPVNWVINGVELTGCNNGIKVPKLNLDFDIRRGQQTIEFTPTEEGVIPWSCWMGMIQGRFIVK